MQQDGHKYYSFVKRGKGGLFCSILCPNTAKCWSTDIISSTWSSSTGSTGKHHVPRGAQVLLITWVLRWFGFFGLVFFGMKPYLNLLQLYASAMGRLGSLGEEPGRSPKQSSSPLSFSKELQCKTQSCYSLVEGEVGRKCPSAGHGMDPKSLTHPYSYPVWHRLEMGPVSEEMNLSVISYIPMRSCQSDVVGSAGLAAADPESILALILVIAFPLQLHVRTLDFIVPISLALIIVSKTLCPFDLIPARLYPHWQRQSSLLDNLSNTWQRDMKKYNLQAAIVWISPAGKEPGCRNNSAESDRGVT